MPHSKKCDELVSQTPASAENYAQPVNCGETPTEVAPVPPSPNIYPMNWYNFLVHFWLFASAVIGILYGVCVVSGIYLEEMGGIIYKPFPKWKLVDILAGIFYIEMGVCAIIVRRRLAKYEKEAPKSYITYLIISAVGVVLHIFFIWIVVRDSIGDKIDMLFRYYSPEFILFVGLAVGEIMASRVYFEKRKDLFKY